jgi:hypothetical protein
MQVKQEPAPSWKKQAKKTGIGFDGSQCSLNFFLDFNPASEEKALHHQWGWKG